VNSNQRIDVAIRKATFSKLLPVLLLAAISALAATAFLIQKQISLTQDEELADFIQHINFQIEKLSTQVQSISENDLVINSLVDYTNRDNYLPIFFGSLKPTALKNTNSPFSVVFTDFEGSVVIENNGALHSQNEQNFDWKEAVLENGESVSLFNKHGVFIAYPVLYGESAEGAIAMYISNIRDILYFKAEAHNILLFDGDTPIYAANQRYLEPSSARSGRITPDSSQNSISPGLDLSQAASLNLSAFQHKTTRLNDLTVHTLQSYGSAYSNVVWATIAAIFVFVLIVLGTSYSIQFASRKAASIIKQLQEKIRSLSESTGEDKKLGESENEPLEIRSLRESFNNLMEELSTTTFFKDRVEGVVDSLDEMLVVYDTSLNVMLHNTAFDEFCKKIGCSFEESAHKLFPEAFLELDTTKPKDQRKIEYNEYLVNGRQQTIYIDWRKTLYIDNKQNTVGSVLAGMNITPSVELQKELSLKNQAIDEALTSIIIADASSPGFPVTYVNKAFEKLTGYSAHEMIGTSCKLLQGPETDPKTTEKIRTALGELRPISVTILNYRKDGTQFYNRLSLSPITNSDNNITHILGFQDDVTEQERTTQFLEEARIKAEESTKLKAEFLASMSHEIRTPMNGILGMLGLLDRSQLDAQQSQHLKLAQTSAKSLLVLINDILDFSKVEAGKLTLENVEFDIIDLLGEMAISLACTAEEKQLEIILDTSDVKQRRVIGDTGRLRQILYNLLGNAIKFTPEGHIILRAHSHDCDSNQAASFTFEVIDTGVGIPESHLQSVFDSFSQVDASTTRQFGGTGLGLTISKQLAELMGGDVTASSKVGQGSTFTLSVQLDIPDPHEETELPNFSEKSILLLGSLQEHLDILAKQLNLWSASTQTTTHYSDAIELIKQKRFDVVMIDSNLENIDSNALSSRLIEASANKEVKAILLKPLFETNNRSISHQSVDNTCIPKPVTATKLKDTLNLLLANEANVQTHVALPQKARHTLKDKPSIIGQHALLVEDNPINQILAVALVEGFGMHVSVANHGLEAIEIINKNISENAPNFSIILMDCQMPEMDGYETTGQIRNGACGDLYKTIPIIAMTANAIAGDREKCLDAGMDDYLSKPIDNTLLERKLTQWVEISELSISPKQMTEIEASVEQVSSKNNSINAAHSQLGNEENLDTSGISQETKITDETSTSKDVPPKSIKTWDFDSALNRTLNSEDLLLKVIDVYMSDIPVLVFKLCDALEEADNDQVAYLAHTIKGASLNIDAEPLSQLSLEIELKSKSGENMPVQETISALKSTSEELFSVLNEFTKTKRAS
jgi:PAS domain S-box-containing protein